MADDSRAPPPAGARPDPTLPDPGNTPAPLPAQAAPRPAVRLQVATVAKLNLADFLNAVPALRELAVANYTEATLSDVTLDVALLSRLTDAEPAKLRFTLASAKVPAAGSYQLSPFSRIRGRLLLQSRAAGLVGITTGLRDFRGFSI